MTQILKKGTILKPKEPTIYEEVYNIKYQVLEDTIINDDLIWIKLKILITEENKKQLIEDIEKELRRINGETPGFININYKINFHKTITTLIDPNDYETEEPQNYLIQ